MGIHVMTSKGVVSLTSIVNSEAERQQAIRLTQAVKGVLRVDASNLFVKY